MMQRRGQTDSAGQQPAVAPNRRRPPVPPVPPEFQAGKIMKMDSPELVEILNNAQAATFQKAKACMRLAMVGTRDAVPALAAMLADKQLAHYARFGLVPIPDPSVDDALRGALKKLKGPLLVGVIDSIGQRKDAGAVEPVARLMYDPDPQVAQAAAATLGRISGPQATKALQAGLARIKGPARSAVAAACLVCAEGLMAQGDRKGALALYDALSRPDMPKSVRLAAMHNIIAAETSLTRPR
ncbi:MAG: HEAT repeat domain-containing protein [Bryobacteraceae bacterium]